MIERIAYTGTSADDKYLDLSVQEICEIHEKIVYKWETKLRKFGVVPLWNVRKKEKEDLLGNLFSSYEKENVFLYSAKELQLIFLAKYMKKLVHKDLISAFVRKYFPDVAFDQQVRHLGTQLHWGVLNKGAEIPDEDEIVPSGYHILFSLDLPNPRVYTDGSKRRKNISFNDFEDLKEIYHFRCATCGIQEGEIDVRNNGEHVKLQEGHMDPDKGLSLSNVIPQCQYCNRTYGDNFYFDKNGCIVGLHNPKLLLKSSPYVQEEMIAVLLKEREKRSNKIEEENMFHKVN